MENFTFYAPTLFAFGDGQEQTVGALVRRFGGTRVLMVLGGGSARRNGAYDAAAAALQAAQLPFGVLEGVQPNPRSGKVQEGIRRCREEGYDFLLAVGGGSVIDTAKAIGAGVPYAGDFWDFFNGTAEVRSTLPVGVVLTLAAAGSEGSDSCVITREEGELKWGMRKSDLIRPKFAVLAPRFTAALPPYQLACGAADMVAHVCERYFTNTPNVALTDRLGEAVMRTVAEAAPRAAADPGDTAAHADLMWAGMLAHNNSCGVGRAQDWASHQIEHELSALFDCPHGAGLAAVMPAWMEYVMPHDPGRFARFGAAVFGCKTEGMDAMSAAAAGIAAFRSWLRELGLPTSLAELGVGEEAIPALVAHRAEKPNAFPFGGFVKIDAAGMAAILRLAAPRR